VYNSSVCLEKRNKIFNFFNRLSVARTKLKLAHFTGYQWRISRPYQMLIFGQHKAKHQKNHNGYLENVKKNQIDYYHKHNEAKKRGYGWVWLIWQCWLEVAMFCCLL
jgi:hypothetical protein